MSDQRRLFVEYLLLLLGFAILFFLFVLFRGNTMALKSISGAGVIFYVIWGLAHHAVSGRLSKLVAFEYLLVGSLVFLILYTALSF